MDDKKNTGDYNTGYRNTGYRNTGNFNTGDYNTGYRNTGNFNTGYYNTGNHNTGDYNTGYRNTGNFNTGYFNTGNHNTGNHNTGYYNTGNFNTGNFNTGDCNTGFFCTETPKATLFDQPSDLTHEEVCDILPHVDLVVSCQWIDQSEMTDQEKKDNPNYAVFNGYLKSIKKPIQEVFPLWWKSTTQENRDKFLNLPNFDADKFLKCTGVDVRKKEVKFDDSVNERIAKLQKEIDELKKYLRNS